MLSFKRIEIVIQSSLSIGLSSECYVSAEVRYAKKARLVAPSMLCHIFQRGHNRKTPFLEDREK